MDSMKALLKMGFAFAKVVEDLADGFDFSDLKDILLAAKSIPGGIASAPVALAAYIAMTDAEAAELESWVIAECDLKNDNVEQVIEAGLNAVIQLHELVKLLKPKA